MLTEQLSQLVREAGGESLLLDARQGRALLGDSSRVLDLCKQLRNLGFTRLIDFTAMHLGVEQIELVHTHVAAAAVPPDSQAAAAPPDRELTDRFQLWLTLRALEHGHSALTLKWSWPPAVGASRLGRDCAPADGRGIAAEGGQLSAPTGESDDEPEAEAVDVDPELARLGVAAHAIKPPGGLEELSEGNGDALPHPPAGGEARSTNGDEETGYNGDGGAGQPGDPSRQAGSAAHPSLSHIWPAAGLAEREIWEMLGLRFTGHDDLRPLLLDGQFPHFPLRQGYEAPRREAYAARLLNERHERAMLAALGKGGGEVVGPDSVPVRADETKGDEDGHGDPSHQDPEDSGGAE